MASTVIVHHSSNDSLEWTRLRRRVRFPV